jgi:hypothetical protein
MPSELLKAAVWGSIWRPQGGLGTLEQMHSPFRVPSPGCPPASPPTAPGRARPSELTVRDSDGADSDDRGTQGTIVLAPSTITTLRKRAAHIAWSWASSWNRPGLEVRPVVPGRLAGLGV